jgi:hypothetical protein
MKNKQIFKKLDGKCYFCQETQALDAHRIIPGSQGGKYRRHNVITVCPTHHRKIHLGQIEILGRHFTSAGCHVIHYREDGEEKWGNIH